MKKIYFIFIVAFFFYCCASSIYSLPEDELDKISTRIYKYNYKTVVNACIEAIEKEGFIIENINSEYGLIKTDWKFVSNPLALQGHYRYKASVRIKQIEPKKIKVILTIPNLQYPPRFFENEWINTPITKNHIEHFDSFFKNVEKILN